MHRVILAAHRLHGSAARSTVIQLKACNSRMYMCVRDSLFQELRVKKEREKKTTCLFFFHFDLNVQVDKLEIFISEIVVNEFLEERFAERISTQVRDL